VVGELKPAADSSFLFVQRPMMMPSSHSEQAAAADIESGPLSDLSGGDDACCAGPATECAGDVGVAHVEAGGSCPTPLSWRGVLKKFRDEATVHIVQRNGYQMYCRTWGEGAPLYFLNGFGGTSELFALTASLLRDEHRCVLFDEFSTEPEWQLPPRTTTPAETVEDLFAIADYFGDEVLSLYGATLGGAVGLAAMQAHPHRVCRAALQGGFAHRHFSPAERLLAWGARYMPGRLQNVPLHESVQRQNHRPWFPPFDGSRWKFLAENLGGVPLRVIARRTTLARRIDLRLQLSQISQPALIIRTEGEGRIASACQAELIARLPNVVDVWVDNTGQLPFLTHPHRLSKLLKPFYRGEPLPLPVAGSAPPEVLDIAASPFAKPTETHDD